MLTFLHRCRDVVGSRGKQEEWQLCFRDSKNHCRSKSVVETGNIDRQMFEVVSVSYDDPQWFQAISALLC